MERFIGTFKLVSFEVIFENKKRKEPFGEDPEGILMYDKNGNMMVQFMRRKRLLFSSDDLGKGTLNEIKTAFDEYASYFGTYTVNDEDRVIHYLKGCLFPNWIGLDQVRYFEFYDKFLKLISPSMKVKNIELVNELVWERIT
jgi:hypothetical protein